MYFESENTLETVSELIGQGFSVVVDALSYIGNGKWVNAQKKSRYQYKMIVPILSDDGLFYSTDLYKGCIENAVNAPYALYRSTQQKVIGTVLKVDTDYNINRFGFGYRDGNYGIRKLIDLLDNK